MYIFITTPMVLCVLVSFSKKFHIVIKSNRYDPPYWKSSSSTIDHGLINLRSLIATYLHAQEIGSSMPFENIGTVDPCVLYHSR